MFSAGDMDQHQLDILIHNLQKLGEDQKTELESMLSLEELTTAVQQMASERAPGVDGLPSVFYKHFWGWKSWVQSRLSIWRIVQVLSVVA